MQFIDGLTLAQLIHELRRQAGADTAGDRAGQRTPDPEQTTPYQADAAPPAEDAATATVRDLPAHAETPPPSPPPWSAGRGRDFFRTAARLAVQAAGALEHAHQLGVVHRDIKPGNLLVDGRGELWVTDFGLAQVQGDAKLTLTGDLVGTLRYMSPEQALAQRVLVDHRSDVYSLGVTLYELLTLEPAFAGNDRQELLRQIAFEEPAPPRRLNKAIPGELETIVLKAMEKNPADRYGTGQELADDLERFLKDEPIRARRPSAWQRLRRWGRRHRPVVAAGAALLVTLLVVGGVGAWRYERDQAAQAVARIARQAATARPVEAALTEAETLLTLGDEQRDAPERWQALVEQARSAMRRAEALLSMGEATDELLERVAQVRAAVDAAAEDSALRTRLDRIWVGAHLRKDDSSLPRVSRRYADALRSYGVDPAQPARAVARARGSRLRLLIAEALGRWAATTPDHGERQRLLALFHAIEPVEESFLRRVGKVERRNDGAALAKLVAEPAAQRLPTLMLVDLAADLMHHKQWTAAEALLRARQQEAPDDFWLNFERGSVILGQGRGRAEEASAYLRAALALRPRSPEANIQLGVALAWKRDLDGAMACFQAALAIDPKEPVAHYNAGNVLRDKGDLDGAMRSWRTAADLDRSHLLSRHNLGLALLMKGDLDGAVRWSSAALAVYPYYAPANVNLGNALLRKGDLKGAVCCFGQAIADRPEDAVPYLNLGIALERCGDPEGAIHSYQEALKYDNKYAAAQVHWARILGEQGKLDAAVRGYEAALRMDRHYALAHVGLGNVALQRGDLDGAARHYRDGLRINAKDGVAQGALGHILTLQGRFGDARTATAKALELLPRDDSRRAVAEAQLKRCDALLAHESKLAAVLRGQARPTDAGEARRLAWLCEQPYKQLYATAAGLYQTAFGADPRLADDPASAARYRAACAAVLAGCGRGKDAATTDGAARARLRQQALDWLRAELAVGRRLLQEGRPGIGPAVAQRLRQWLEGPELAGVREKALNALPQTERQGWEQLWADVKRTAGAAGGADKKSAADNRPGRR
jgi:tetratricopeptide (TPR) repeat protein